MSYFPETKEMLLENVCNIINNYKITFNNNNNTNNNNSNYFTIVIIILNNDNQRNRLMFLRYVFHEVRVPLNSVMMGIDFLTQNNPIKNNMESSWTH